MPTQNPPSIRSSAFECPHCGAYTTQYWYTLHADRRNDNSPPNIPDGRFRAMIEQDPDMPAESKRDLLGWADNMEKKLGFFEKRNSDYPDVSVQNVFLTRCYHCRELAVWIHDGLIFPDAKVGVEPNEDLPADIKRDFEEARDIISKSPRGASALLRLCVQKLCSHLGEKGKSIDDDIASLVAKGLNPLVQKSLDIVRVVGNESVHPGVMDMRDDGDTALKLLQIVNAITDQMISHPKNIEALYDTLPEGKREAIEKRDSKKAGPGDS